jgi:DNA invertase Pin-like site-specific DNA recombinase
MASTYHRMPGRLMANVVASVATYETEMRSERQMTGIAAAAKAKRVKFGRRQCPPARFLSAGQRKVLVESILARLNSSRSREPRLRASEIRFDS